MVLSNTCCVFFFCVFFAFYCWTLADLTSHMEAAAGRANATPAEAAALQQEAIVEWAWERAAELPALLIKVFSVTFVTFFTSFWWLLRQQQAL